MNEATMRYLAGLAWERAQRQAERQLAEARTWPGFLEHERMIAKAMKTDPDLSLADAYRQVVFAACLEGDWALTPDGFVRR